MNHLLINLLAIALYLSAGTLLWLGLRRAQPAGSMAALTTEDSGAMYLASHGHRIPSQSTLTLASQSLR